LDIGRQPLDIARIEAGAALCDFDFSPHDDHVLLTGLDNAKSLLLCDRMLRLILTTTRFSISIVKVFTLPEADEAREGLIGDQKAELKGHQRRITTSRVTVFIRC
jgi:hypothetical protein